jgi:hypothetical protein
VAEKQIGWRKIEKAAPDEFVYAGGWDGGKWYEGTGWQTDLVRRGFTHYLPISLLELPEDPANEVPNERG